MSQREEDIELYKKQVEPYMDENGLFPDNILGDSFWVLSYCEKVWIGSELFWRFVE